MAESKLKKTLDRILADTCVGMCTAIITSNVCKEFYETYKEYGQEIQQDIGEVGCKALEYGAPYIGLLSIIGLSALAVRAYDKRVFQRSETNN